MGGSEFCLSCVRVRARARVCVCVCARARVCVCVCIYQKVVAVVVRWGVGVCEIIKL